MSTSQTDESLPRGVTRKGDRYRARISYNHKTICLGWYDTPGCAADAYNTARAVKRWKIGSNWIDLPVHRRLWAWRVLRGLSPKTVAARAGILTTNYRRLERGEREPGLPLAKRLAVALGIDLNALGGLRLSVLDGLSHVPCYLSVPCLPDRLAELRQRAEFTERDLATRADVDIRTVRVLEKGSRTPSFPLALRLAAALGVTVDDLAAPPGSPVTVQPGTKRRHHYKVRDLTLDSAPAPG